MTINIDKLRKAHAATKERTTPNFRKLSNKDLRGAELPFTAYEVDFHFNAQRDCPYKATIHEIKITRFGVAPRCSSESVDFMSRGQRCIGSADLFYPSREDAQAYADWALEDARAVTAQEDFQALAHNEFPALLDEIERLRRVNYQWDQVFGHLGETPDECGNAIHAEFDKRDAEIERLRAQVSEARGLLTEFERTIDNACDGDHPCADEVRACLEENK